MNLEKESPKVEVLKLPKEKGWQILLREYYEIVREEVGEEEQELYYEYKKQPEIPSFLDRGVPTLTGTEKKYTSLIMGDLFEEEELDSYEHTRGMHNWKHYNLNIVNYRKAWDKVSSYLTSLGTLQNDLREKIEGRGGVTWDEPQESIPIDLNLQMRLVPNG